MAKIDARMPSDVVISIRSHRGASSSKHETEFLIGLVIGVFDRYKKARLIR